MGNSDAIFPVESVCQCDILEHDQVENILDDAPKSGVHEMMMMKKDHQTSILVVVQNTNATFNRYPRSRPESHDKRS
jgi:hypothetical protein